MNMRDVTVKTYTGNPNILMTIMDNRSGRTVKGTGLSVIKLKRRLIDELQNELNEDTE